MIEDLLELGVAWRRGHWHEWNAGGWEYREQERVHVQDGVGRWRGAEAWEMAWALGAGGLGRGSWGSDTQITDNRLGRDLPPWT